jgi:DNA invertase Pin-like site-specific DNA recombinase
LIDSFAEYERLLISARTRAALAAKRRRGERVSGIVPFGSRLSSDGRTLEANPEEAATLQTIRRLRAQGQSLRAVAETLNAAGVLTRAQKPWRFEYVRNLLRDAAGI